MAKDRKIGELVTVQPMSSSMESTNISGVPFGIRLNDTNFKVWSKMMEVHAAGLGKHGYLTGKIPVMEEDSPGYTKWWYWELKKQLKTKGKRTGQAKLAESGDGGAAITAGRIGSNCNIGQVAMATKCSEPRPHTSAHGLEKQMGHNLGGKLQPTAEECTDQMLSLTKQISNEDTSNMSTALLASIKRDSGWIIDSGATDHMTYDKSLFHHMTFPPKENVITANGEVAPVTGAGLINLTPSLSLHNTLLVPSLSNNLLSVGQVTEQLDCVVLMFPTFCLLQDIQTRAIIGRGTKRRGLYYVEDVAPGRSDFRCNDCILAKIVTSYFWMCGICASSKNQRKPLTRPLNGPELFGSARMEMDGTEAAAGPANNNPYSPLPVHAHVPEDIQEYMSTHRLSPKYQAFVSQMAGVKIPTKVEEALQDPRWIEAMKVEMEALQRNGTWNVVPLPYGKRPVGCKWVFTIKHKTDGSIDRYKARLVAKGYTQTFGVDYQETFAPVAKMNTIRVLLSLAANFDWPLKYYLSSEFEMKDLGGLKYFLEIEVARSRDGIYLCQRKYVLDLLSETGMLTCKPAETPIVQNHHLAIYQDQIPTNKERYQRLIKGYTDADWAGNITDRRSISGYFTFVARNLVTWRSKKQNVVARSTAEAEYRANNPVQHDRRKHVEVDIHFIKEKLEVDLIDIPYVKSEEQLADVLTHAVSVKVFQDSLDKHLISFSRMQTHKHLLLECSQGQFNLSAVVCQCCEWSPLSLGSEKKRAALCLHANLVVLFNPLQSS
ncbi:hypothetical protein D8674_012898 [Pyrus ussuriensis x Pyrus communis]|uniref:Reverse transcriptase Ty1/copia-type domain-containing protein n=1 Tax=Pyrus ussuriensis x Pyrus communis TaxID=2448454 RepID=A0A5N5GNA8_9ROSA|nr:hypothetical protein D8674_012898 [Pyrus ussuriensis x Pyrus communis]